MRNALAALALAALLAASPTARADAQRSAAESFRQARAAYDRGQFSAAAAAFEQAAAFAPHPAALLSAADAWEQAGEIARAAEDCDRALALPSVGSASKEDGVPYARDATRCLTRLSPRIVTLEIRGPRTLGVRVDAGAQETPPTRRRLAPGHHVIAVVDLGTSASHELSLDFAAGEARILDLTAAPPPPPPIAPAAPPPTPDAKPADPVTPAPGVRTSAWVAFGVAGAAAVAAGVSVGFLAQAQHDYDVNPTIAGRDAFRADIAPTDVALGVAAAAAVTGVLLLLVPRPAKPPPGTIALGVLRF